MTRALRPRARVLFPTAAALAVLVLLVAALVRQVGGGDTTGACDHTGDAPGGRWCRIYQEDFNTPAELGSFGGAEARDWYLKPGHPYAESLRSYPDAWGTTKDYSLNFASRTADVVPQARGARGVFRLHGHSEDVDGQVRALGGSFYPVIHPLATDQQQQVAQTYGRYTVRFTTSGGYRPDAAGRFDETGEPSYGTAFLLWPANDQWTEGEIDYPEMRWGASIAGAVHTIGRPEVNAVTFSTSTSTEDWHTATLKWTPELLVFVLDGVEVQRVTSDVPSTPFRWGFQSGGTLGVPAADLAGYLYIDNISIDAFASRRSARAGESGG